MQLLSNLAYGATIGGALGLTGTGGSILAVPALVYLVGQEMHTAIGTSLAVVGGIAAEGAVGQRDTTSRPSVDYAESLGMTKFGFDREVYIDGHYAKITCTLHR